MNRFKKDFPIFKKYPKLIYLDNAATSQKPQSVIKAVSDFYTLYNSNVHRGLYTLSQQATSIFEQTRQSLTEFVNASSPQEIIFTKNASEAINLVAFGYAKQQLHKGDVVLLSQMEHHSNIVPWLQLKKTLGIKLVFLPITSDYRLDYTFISPKTPYLKSIKLITLTQASNVLGTLNPIQKIISYYKSLGIQAPILVDAAQSAPHVSINVKKLNCDFLAFSSHKMLGPSGLGVLWVKNKLFSSLSPVYYGSHMISQVSQDTFKISESPDRYEVGTASLEAVAGLGAAIKYLQHIGYKRITEQETKITTYALKKFKEIPDLKLYGSSKSKDRLAIFSFNIANIHSHDVSEILNRYHICVRAGHHCAQPLLQELKISSTVRASFYFYNSISDVDKLIQGLKQVKKIFLKKND